CEREQHANVKRANDPATAAQPAGATLLRRQRVPRSERLGLFLGIDQKQKASSERALFVRRADCPEALGRRRRPAELRRKRRTAPARPRRKSPAPQRSAGSRRKPPAIPPRGKPPSTAKSHTPTANPRRARPRASSAEPRTATP